MTIDEIKILIQQMIEPLKKEIEELHILLDKQATEISILKQGGNL